MLALDAILAVVTVDVVVLPKISALAVKAVVALVVGIAAIAIVAINAHVAVGNIVGGVILFTSLCTHSEHAEIDILPPG